MAERKIQSGIGSVPVKAPRVRDRHSAPLKRIRFSSTILPPYLRRTKSMEELIPWLYQKSVSTGDFSDALAALVGKEAPGLSAPTISRLKMIWQQDFDQWRQRYKTNILWSVGMKRELRFHYVKPNIKAIRIN